MKHIVLCLLMVWMTPVSWGADFANGFTAAPNGDFATTLSEYVCIRSTLCAATLECGLH